MSLPRQVRLLALLACLTIVVQNQTLGQALSAREIAQKALPAVVLLVMEDKNGQPISLGSGFFVREGIVATNTHVIRGAVRGYAKIADQKTKYDVEGIVASDPVHDLALLSIKEGRATPLPLSEKADTSVGDVAYAVGNPRGLEGTFSQGIVSSIRKMESDSLLQITAPISPGSSGGPVLNAEGKVIGVAVATFRDGQNLNFAIPVSYLTALMADIKPVVPFADAKGRGEKKSFIDNIGSDLKDGVLGASILWDYPALTSGEFTFTLKNSLRETIKDVYCLIVFYDKEDSPLDFVIIRSRAMIPSGLGKRGNGKVDGSVQKLTTSSFQGTPSTRIEFRVLDFAIVKD